MKNSIQAKITEKIYRKAIEDSRLALRELEQDLDMIGSEFGSGGASDRVKYWLDDFNKSILFLQKKNKIIQRLKEYTG